MCGIVAVFGDASAELEQECAQALALLAHRGPDGSGTELLLGSAVLGHRRLAIMDPGGGAQPLRGPRGSVVVHNGEIYNWRRLRAELEAQGRQFESHSDSEVIAQLYESMGASCVELLDGDFAFAVIYRDRWLVARDPLGVKPLYYGRDADGRLWFASEFKALSGRVVEVEPFPPGHVYTQEGGLARYFRPSWRQSPGVRHAADSAALRARFTAAVEKRMMSDVSLGVLLSGGLDSSLCAAVAARCVRRGGDGRRIPSFSVGVDPASPDLRCARAVAHHIGSEHHETVFDVEDGLARLPEIIRNLESYDVSLVRGSVPMYFLMRDVHQAGVKVVLSGDGSDEAFGGYLYLYQAPDAEEFRAETLSLLDAIHLTELPTVDKLSMQHGVEARVPFMDIGVLDVAMNLDPEIKRPLAGGHGRRARMEKWVLRAAFDDPADSYLPAEVLWRQKEAFEDGVGYSWIDALKEHAERTVPDVALARASERFPYQTPCSKEAYLYRAIFAEHYPGEDQARCVGWWSTRWQADPDPSGRAAALHTTTVAA